VRRQVNRKAIGVLLILLTLTPYALTAQSGESKQDISTPTGFRDISLGLDVNEVKERLQNDPYFDYRGDPDVSFLPQSQDSLIECRGNYYVKRAYFQFAEKKLYIIIILLDRKRIDHYSVFSKLTERYGPFTALTPRKVSWDFENVLFSLERPLALKYIDRPTFEQRLQDGKAAEDLRDISRDRFLENF
jgi:hypothetical protein